MDIKTQKEINLKFIKAIEHEDLDGVRESLKAGAQYQTSDYYAVAAAAITNNKTIVQYLVESNAYNQKTGLTGPLLLALVNAHKNRTLDTAKYLKSKGANLIPLFVQQAILGIVNNEDTIALKYVLDNWGVEELKGSDYLERCAQSGKVVMTQFLIENYGVNTQILYDEGTIEIKKLVQAFWDREKLDKAIAKPIEVSEHKTRKI